MGAPDTPPEPTNASSSTPGTTDSAGAAAESVPPTSAVTAEAPEKQPPPDTPEGLRMRATVIWSFWAVILLMGLPLWWWTTAIYRAPLPLKEMRRWADGAACRAEFPLLVDVEAPLLSDPEHLVKTIQHALDDANDFSAHHLRLRLARPGAEAAYSQGRLQDEVAMSLKLIPGPAGASHTYVLSNTSRVTEVFYSLSYNPSSSASSTSLAAFIAGVLQEIFAEEQQMISHLLSSTSAGSVSAAAASGNSGGGSNSAAADEIARKMSRVMRYSPTYHLTFSLFTASGAPSSWEIAPAIEEYLQPLLDALGGISNFTVDSQMQFYAALSPNVVPTLDEGGGVQQEGEGAQEGHGQERQQGGHGQRWVLKKEDLSSFINSAEWTLASSTSYPTINFVVYIPAPAHSPLIISSSASNSFLLPQWGSVVVHNPPPSSSSSSSPFPSHLDKAALKPILDIFAAQLLALLGAPSHPSSLPVQLDSLARQRSAELLVSASSTLGSLYSLTLALRSISIPASVAAAVAITLDRLTATCQELKHGHFGGPGGALDHGRVAAQQAESAFFEKSMVGQVYFPEEHKVAVYMPLLGPVGVPLLLAAVREIVRVWKAWQVGRRARKGKAVGVAGR